MILHGEQRQLGMRQAFDCLVIEVDVCELRDALERVDVDSEAVILGGDLDLAGGEVHDRLVSAVVSELELVGAPAQRQAEDLVSEADTEDRSFADQVADNAGVWTNIRVAGTVREKNAIRVH